MTSPVVPQIAEALAAKVIDAIDGFPGTDEDRAAIAAQVASAIAAYRPADTDAG